MPAREARIPREPPAPRQPTTPSVADRLLDAAYFTAMVAVLGLLTPLDVSTTGAGPDAAPLGIITSTSDRPSTYPGAVPAYNTVADWPPMVAEIGITGSRRTSLVIKPSCPGGFSGPAPVANKYTTVPAGAGLAAVLSVPS